MDYDFEDYSPAPIGEFWYRCIFISDYGDHRPYYDEFKVVRHTASGVRLLLSERTGATKFVKVWRNYPHYDMKTHMWARPTKELALADYLGRKEWKVKTLERELWQAKREITSIHAHYARRLLLPTPTDVDATQYQQKIVASLRNWISGGKPLFHPVGTKKEFILW